MKTFIAVLTLSVSLCSQTPFVSLYQNARTSPFEGVAQNHLVKMTEGGDVTNITVRPLVAGDGGPVILGIAMDAVGSSSPTRVCTNGYCSCQFSRNPSIPLERGAIVIADAASNTCRVATHGVGNNNTIENISVHTGIVGTVAQDACVDTGICSVEMAGPWHSGTNINPINGSTQLGTGRAQIDASYGNWTPNNSGIFANIPFSGNLHNNGVWPAYPPTIDLLSVPGLISSGERCVSINFYVADTLRTTPFSQISMEMIGESVFSGVSNRVTIMNPSVAGQIHTTLPSPSDDRVTHGGGWMVYMSPANVCDSKSQRFVAQIPYVPGLVEYIINISESDLQANREVPQCNTTSGQFWQQGWPTGLSCTTLQSFTDGSYAAGPMAGNGWMSGYANVFVGPGVGRLFREGDRNFVIGAHGTGTELDIANHPVYDSFIVGENNTNPGRFANVWLAGRNLMAIGPNDWQLSGQAGANGKALVQGVDGVIRPGPLGLTKTITASCGTMVFTNGVLTGGTC